MICYDQLQTKGLKLFLDKVTKLKWPTSNLKDYYNSSAKLSN